MKELSSIVRLILVHAVLSMCQGVGNVFLASFSHLATYHNNCASRHKAQFMVEPEEETDPKLLN